MIVCIPVVNCLNYTRMAVTAARASTEPVKILVIDNASTDDTPRWAAEHADFYIGNVRNIGVAASWNLGAAFAWDLGEDLVCMLNNDAILAPDALTALRVWLAEGVPFPTVTAAPSLSGPRRHLLTLPTDFCGFLWTRDVYDLVGRFDETFWPAYHEDVDYDHRLRLAGVRRGQAMDASALHFHSRSIHEGGVQNEPHFHNNLAYLLQKWGRMPDRLAR